MLPEASKSRFVESLAQAAANGDHWFLPGLSLVMRGIQRVVADIAPTDLPVLLVGERGTGKEVLALHIHRLSHRRDQAFSKLTCAGLTVDKLQRFLEGSTNGAGAAEPYGGGTLFLDELGDLDLSCQALLAEYLASRNDLNGTPPCGARIICATGRNLEERIRSGHFREDLFFRINGIGLRLPPLRHRKEDIPAFLEFFRRKSATYFGRPQPSLSPGAMRLLLEYPWPGNVRELENAVRNIAALGNEEWGLADLQRSGFHPAPPEPAPAATSLKDTARAASRRAERELMLKVLTRTRWNRKMAARELQISYKALLYKLKNLGLEDSANP